MYIVHAEKKHHVHDATTYDKQELWQARIAYKGWSKDVKTKKVSNLIPRQTLSNAAHFGIKLLAIVDVQQKNRRQTS